MCCSIYPFLVTHCPTSRNKMETGSSAEVNDVAMASVDGSIRRDDDYIDGVFFFSNTDMAIHSLNSLEMPLLASAFFSR